MNIENYLAEWNYTMLNKALARKIGISQAVFLCELISQRKRFKQEEFYFTQWDMEKELWLSENTQLRYSKELKEKWLINVEKKWIPGRNRYTINDDKIHSIIMWETCAANLAEQEPPKWWDYSNKKETKNEKINLSSEWESETQKTQTRESRKDTNSTSSTKEWNPPTPQQLLEAYENEKQLVQMIWNSKAVLERAEFKQAKKSKAYKTISWFIQQLYGKVGTVRFWEVRWDTWARFEYAVNRAKEYDWKDIFRTEKDEREYQFYKKSLYLNKQENE